MTIDATPEQLWPLVTDPRLPVGQSPELQEVELVDEGPLQVGSRFRGHNRRGDTGWSTECTVETFAAPSAYAWAVGDPAEAISRFGFTLTPAAGGGTVVTQWVRLGPGRSGLTWAIRQNPDAEEQLIAGRLHQFEASMRDNLEALAARVAATT